jgi:hypothetical protein
MEKSDMRTNLQKFITITRDAVEIGKAIEIGFEELKMEGGMAPNLTLRQVEEQRMSFFAGAKHMYNVLMTITDGIDIDADAARAQKILEEFQRFAVELPERIKKLEGR